MTWIRLLGAMLLLTDLSWKFPEIIYNRYPDPLEEISGTISTRVFFLTDLKKKEFRIFFTGNFLQKNPVSRPESTKIRPVRLLFYRYPGLRSNNLRPRHPGYRPISPSVVFRTHACRSAQLSRTASIHLWIIASRSWPSGTCRTSRTVITARRAGGSSRGQSFRILAICICARWTCRPEIPSRVHGTGR
jgi:hypothetical protein